MMATSAGGPPAGSLLAEGYRRCAALTRNYGTTYYWGAVLLPKARRRYVYGVYALCRLADDIVDDGAGVSTAGKAAGLAAFADHFRGSLRRGTSADPVIAAVVDTVLRTGIDPECFDRFFSAMAMDLTTSRYETWDDLCGYMEGSAAVIGEMMLPVLEPMDPMAREPARALGFAFQLTNFLRDVAEDLDLGRVYLPQVELRRFGADPQRRTADAPWREFLAFQIERNRELYRLADTGIPMLPPRSAKCVGAARLLYSQILNRIEAADYDVFRRRVRVPTRRKVTTAARILLTGPPTGRRVDPRIDPEVDPRPGAQSHVG